MINNIHVSLIIIAATIIAACQRGTPRSSVTAAPADSIDIIETAFSAERDDSSRDQTEEEITIPKTADELFDDFIFNFVSDGRFQKSRIVFPLKVTDNGTPRELYRKDWRIDHFFLPQERYIIILDKENDKDIVNDTTVTRVCVEKILINDGIVTHHHFSRDNGLWRMRDILTAPLEESPNAAFLTFYQRFITDTVYQSGHLAPTIHITITDPDDDFTIMDGFVTAESWPVSRPADLPEGMVYNIVYEKAPAAGSQQKVLVIRGVANGYELQLFFLWKEDQWQLTRMIQ